MEFFFEDTALKEEEGREQKDLKLCGHGLRCVSFPFCKPTLQDFHGERLLTEGRYRHCPSRGNGAGALDRSGVTRALRKRVVARF